MKFRQNQQSFQQITESYNKKFNLGIFNTDLLFNLLITITDFFDYSYQR